MKNYDLPRICWRVFLCILGCLCNQVAQASFTITVNNLSPDVVTVNISMSGKIAGDPFNWSGPINAPPGQWNNFQQGIDGPITVSSQFGGGSCGTGGSILITIPVSGVPGPVAPPVKKIDFCVTNNTQYPQSYSFKNPINQVQQSRVLPPGQMFCESYKTDGTIPDDIPIHRTTYGPDGGVLDDTIGHVPKDAWKNEDEGGGSKYLSDDPSHIPIDDPALRGPGIKWPDTPGNPGGGLNGDTSELAKEVTLRTGFETMKSVTTGGFNNTVSSINRAIAILEELKGNGAAMVTINGNLLSIKATLDQLKQSVVNGFSNVSTDLAAIISGINAMKNELGGIHQDMNQGFSDVKGKLTIGNEYLKNIDETTDKIAEGMGPLTNLLSMVETNTRPVNTNWIQGAIDKVIQQGTQASQDGVDKFNSHSADVGNIGGEKSLQDSSDSWVIHIGKWSVDLNPLHMTWFVYAARWIKGTIVWSAAFILYRKIWAMFDDKFQHVQLVQPNRTNSHASQLVPGLGTAAAILICSVIALLPAAIYTYWELGGATTMAIIRTNPLSGYVVLHQGTECLGMALTILLQFIPVYILIYDYIAYQTTRLYFTALCYTVTSIVRCFGI